MRRLRSAVSGLALVAALVACAEQPDQVGFGGQPDPQPPESSHPAPSSDPPSSHPPSSHPAPPAAGAAEPTWPAVPAAGRPLPPAQVDASALPEDYPRLVWLEGDGRIVGGYGQEGGCTQVRSDLREQTPQLVRIAFVEVTTSAGPCTTELRFEPLTVQLDNPLGDRTVVLERQTIGP